MTLILLVGGADTGRAPMAAALLRRMFEQRGIAAAVESAGVVGHDGSSAEPEARDTMAHMGLDISAHEARSLSDELAESAALLLAVDSGTARVLRARFPTLAPRVRSLGELAGRSRDVPDPFRMQIGAWIAYARELEALLTAGLPRLSDMLGAPSAPAEPAATPGAALPPERDAALERIDRVLALALEMPDLLDWAATRGQLETLFDTAAVASDEGDMAPTYAALLRAALVLVATPDAARLAGLREAATRLRRPIAPADVAWLSAQLGGWAR